MAAGYGLEGRLTDAEPSFIINRIITPAFRKGDFPAGIVNGASAMIQVLGGEPLAVSQGQQRAVQEKRSGGRCRCRLIFVSEAERYVEILVDQGIA